MKSACTAASVPYVTHHGLRHAYANILLDEGKDIVTISKALGHTNPTVTQNIYLKARDEKVREAVESVRIFKK